MRFECPYLAGHVELTDEREAHIRSAHHEVLPKFLVEFETTLRDPDSVLTRIDSERAFVRHWPEMLGGKGMMVVVVTDPLPSNEERERRHWVVTAYIVPRLPGWKVDWTRG